MRRHAAPVGVKYLHLKISTNGQLSVTCVATAEKVPVENDTPFENYYLVITGGNGSRSVLSTAGKILSKKCITIELLLDNSHG
jgi:hypothetical protein